MEGNKDEAMKCCHLAEKFIRAGYHEKALKFLNKSKKLFPTEKAEGSLYVLCNIYSFSPRESDLLFFYFGFESALITI